VILCLMIEGGLGRSEVSGLKVEDVELTSNARLD
jgi:hypothetical protein